MPPMSDFMAKMHKIRISFKLKFWYKVPDRSTLTVGDTRISLCVGKVDVSIYAKNELDLTHTF